MSSGDIFEVVMRPDASCVTSDSVVSNTVQITVTPAPIVTLDPFSNLCLNDAPIALTGGLPAGGTYSGNGVSGGTFDPQQAGIGGHIITYTYIDPVTGCTNSATKNITINNPPPQPSVTYNNFVLKADPITPSYSYQWLDGQGNAIPGATDTIYIPTVTGDYAVEITFINGCKNTSALYTVTQIGINEFDLTNGFGLYPNPADKQVTIQVKINARTDLSIGISDMAGRLVLAETYTLQSGMHEIDLNLESLPAGIYLVELNDGEHSSSRKFTKK